eukprot:g2847.t1
MCSSGGGFFSNLKRQVEEELAKNKELKKSVEKLQKDGTLNKAAEAAEKAARRAARVSEKVGSKTKDQAIRAAEQAKEAAAKASEQASKTKETLSSTGTKISESSTVSRLTETFRSFTRQSEEKARETAERASETTEKLKSKVTDSAEEVGRSSVAKNLKETVSSFTAHPTVASAAETLRETKVLEGWGDAARELFGQKKQMRKVKVSSPPPVANESDAEDKEGDEEEEEEPTASYEGPGALMHVEVEKTGWQKFSERLSKTPIIEDILSGTKRARRVVGRSKVGKAAGEAKTAVDDMREELR